MTFMKRPPGKSLELFERVDDEGVFRPRLGGHVVQLLDAQLAVLKILAAARCIILAITLSIQLCFG